MVEPTNSREITYAEAISEGSLVAMERDDNVFIVGIGVDYSSAVFGTTAGPLARYGKKRVLDVPAMENALTGIAVGAAAHGKRPVLVHYRNDFMFLSFDALINLASKWKHMFGGNADSTPIVVRGIVGRGWGQGATHSQAIHGSLAHYPGLVVICPYSPADAKGMLISALEQDQPVVIIEHRSLFQNSGLVEDGYSPRPLTGAEVVRAGGDITLVGISQGVDLMMTAADGLAAQGIDAEVVDVRCVRPLDAETITQSVKKTGCCVVADISWPSFGTGAEIAAALAEADLPAGKRVIRLGQTELPAPAASNLEQHYYPSVNSVIAAAGTLLGVAVTDGDYKSADSGFKGPY
jgi:pyruvate/2-oxoglutarate/acetoin dehydrogenase E1 component